MAVKDPFQVWLDAITEYVEDIARLVQHPACNTEGRQMVLERFDKIVEGLDEWKEFCAGFPETVKKRANSREKGTVTAFESMPFLTEGFHHFFAHLSRFWCATQWDT